MGLLLSRIYSTKSSTRDTLERIEQEIQNIEERRWDKSKREQFIVQILSFLPITILIANICILIYPSESTWRDKLLLSIPIIILNLFLYMCRRMVQWYSRWSLLNEETRLRKLQKEKKRILDMVCETESYRVATELLEKYDPRQLRRKEARQERPTSPLNTTLTKFTATPIRSPKQQPQPSQQQLGNASLYLNQSMSLPSPAQHRVPVPNPPPPTPIAPVKHSPPSQLNTTITNVHNTSITPIAASSVQGRPVRPVLSKDRSFFEKMVDWVVADGPDNRFALICRYCYGHNGMSLAEEYETINFRCCYCYNLNTATKKHQQVHDQLQPERERSESTSSTAASGTTTKANDNNGNGKSAEKESSKSEDSETKSRREKNKHKTEAFPSTDEKLSTIEDVEEEKSNCDKDGSYQEEPTEIDIFKSDEGT